MTRSIRPAAGLAKAARRRSSTARPLADAQAVARSQQKRKLMRLATASHEARRLCIASCQGAARDTGRMVDDTARDRAIYHALKAADEVAAALQAHLIEEHGADLDRTAARNPSTDSLKLLRQARERLGEGLRAVEADNIAESDKISLRNQ
jgi:hypothetical protein